MPKKRHERVIGQTVSFEDYHRFQRVEATPTELESLTLLERSIAKGWLPRFRPVITYVLALIIGVIGVGIGIYILKSLGILG